jgi:hypothetical protein
VRRHALERASNSYEDVFISQGMCAWKCPHALSLSVDVPGCRDTRRRDWASIWSKERLTDGKSGRERWEVNAFEELSNEDKSAMGIA